MIYNAPSKVPSTGEVALKLERKLLSMTTGRLHGDRHLSLEQLLLLFVDKNRTRHLLVPSMPILKPIASVQIGNPDALSEVTYGNSILHMADADDPPLIVMASSLPSMCGGTCMYVTSPEDITRGELSKLLIAVEGAFGAGGSLTGTTTTEEYDEDYGDYDYKTLAEGVVGQLIIHFSRSLCDDSRLKFLEMVVAQLTDRQGYGEAGSTPSTSTVKWLGEHIVGVFTNYEYISEEYESSGPYEDCLDNMVYDSELPMMNLRVTAGANMVAATYIEAWGIEGKSICDSAEIMLRDVLIPKVTSVTEQFSGCMITDHDHAQYDNVCNTRDVIEYLNQYGAPSVDGVRSWTAPDVIGAASRKNAVPVVWVPFPPASNPNEGAHDITGGMLVREYHMTDEQSTKLMEGHVVSY